jgi:tetratricopeptide (TPR) repeat protein
MKVAHKKDNPAIEPSELLVAGAMHKKQGNLTAAADDYEKLLKQRPLLEKVYDRLMIIYRSQKEYKKELGLINAAIKTFESNYEKKKKASGKKITQLSKALLKATGLSDKNGNNIYDFEPTARWKKRKVTVLNKLKKRK